MENKKYNFVRIYQTTCKIGEKVEVMATSKEEALKKIEAITSNPRSIARGEILVSSYKIINVNKSNKDKITLEVRELKEQPNKKK